MRRTVKTRYSSGEQTRARILNVAVNMFGSKGYDSVSTREIAQAASVPPASLRYYFENKQGLYIACLNHIQALTLEAVEPALRTAEALLQEPEPDTDRLIDAFCTLQAAHIDHMIKDSGTTALFMIRHDLPSAGGESSFRGDGTIARRMMACLVRMVMTISGNMLDSQASLVIAGLINSQITLIYLRRNRLAEMGWDLTPERLLWLKQTVRTNTAAILKAHRGGCQSTAS